MCIARKLYIGSLAISRAINKEIFLIVEPYLNWEAFMFRSASEIGNCHGRFLGLYELSLKYLVQ